MVYIRPCSYCRTQLSAIPLVFTGKWGLLFVWNIDVGPLEIISKVAANIPYRPFHYALNVEECTGD